MQKEKQLFQFKVAVVGNSTVGKTSLIHRFTRNAFLEQPNQYIQPVFKFKDYETSDRIIRLNIWDTQMNEKFKPMNQLPQYRADGYVFVYSIIDKYSFDNIRFWIKDMQIYECQYSQKILIGNKVDLEQNRQITQYEGQSLAKEFGMNFIETSAKNDININAAFINLADEIYEEKIDNLNKTQSINFQQVTTSKQPCSC